MLGTGSDICQNDPNVIIQIQDYNHGNNANGNAFGVDLLSNIGTLAVGNAVAGFTDNGDGTLTIDPTAVTTIGTYVIGYFINDSDNSCHNEIVYETVEILPLYAPEFTIDGEVCADLADITLNLITAVSGLPNGVTVDEAVRWYGSNNNFVIDLSLIHI